MMKYAHLIFVLAGGVTRHVYAFRKQADAVQSNASIPGDNVTLCKLKEYCSGSTSWSTGACDGECLPCDVDPDGVSNLLRCSTCTLHRGAVTCATCDIAAGSYAFAAGSYSSSPPVQLKPPPDYGLVHPKKGLLSSLLGDTTRGYCRPPTISVGNLPGLCDKPIRDMLPAAVSLGEIWKVLDGTGRFVEKRVRLRPYLPMSHDGSRSVYISTFPPDFELATHWPQAGMQAEQMFIFKLHRHDQISASKLHPHKILDGAIWALTRAQKDNGYMVDLCFAREVLDKNEDQLLDPPCFRLTEDAISALGACFDFLQHGRIRGMRGGAKKTQEVLRQARELYAANPEGGLERALGII